MSSIFENAGKIHIAVVKDKETNQGDLALALSALAVKAITKGPTSKEWKQYMSLFAENDEQLRLLTEPKLGEVEGEQAEEFYVTKARAYIVSNAVCAAGTNTATTNGVEDTHLVTTSNAPDGSVQRPADIQTLLDAVA